MSIPEETSLYIDLVVGRLEGKMRNLLSEQHVETMEAIHNLELENAAAPELINVKIEECRRERVKANRWAIGLVLTIAGMTGGGMGFLFSVLSK